MARNPIERALGVWSTANYRDVMLPGLGVVTCGELCDAIAAERALAERAGGVNEDALRALAQAYDREDAAQRGEPDPWNLDDPGDIGDSDTWVSERLACARAAAEAFLSALSLSALVPASHETGNMRDKRTCATEGCDNPATNEFIRGDVGSFYCGDCFAKVIEVCDHPAPQTDAFGVRSLQDFAKWVIREGAFQAADLDGLSIQEKAHELGLINRTTYNPQKHGPSDCAEPGDEWFVFSPLLSAIQPDDSADLTVAHAVGEVEPHHHIEVTDAGLLKFAEWFRKNYPGPDTIIYRPDWHSPKIYRAALHAAGLTHPTERAVAERIALLDAFLGALDEWGCADEDRAEAIIDFIDGGYNLSEYEDRAKLRVITGGRDG